MERRGATVSSYSDEEEGRGGVRYKVGNKPVVASRQRATLPESRRRKKRVRKVFHKTLPPTYSFSLAATGCATNKEKNK